MLPHVVLSSTRIYVSNPDTFPQPNNALSDLEGIILCADASTGRAVAIAAANKGPAIFLFIIKIFKKLRIRFNIQAYFPSFFVFGLVPCIIISTFFGQIFVIAL